ncbi:MAG: hypothetical protein U0235_06865 [Polyangiaceae bacterium]
MATPTKDAKVGAFFVAGHDILFHAPLGNGGPADDAPRCDACGEPVGRDDDDDGFAVSGRGRYVFTRGDELRAEEPPLCASCAAAIGMTALHLFTIEEDEG